MDDQAGPGDPSEPGDRAEPGDPVELEDEDPFGPGWWVGSDGYWHPPDERFGDDTPDRNHPVRRVVVVLLVLAVIGATSVGVWAGTGAQSTPGTAGPPLQQLTSKVRQAVAGAGGFGGFGGFGAATITGVICHPPSSWTAGRSFTCDVTSSPHQLVGRYHGTVLPSSASGAWRWTGAWSPVRPAPVNE